MISFYPLSIRVPVETLKNGADRLAELSENVKDYFDQIGNAAANLSAGGSWVGEDSMEFIQVNTANQKKYAKTVEDMEQMAAKLKEYALAMENVDHEWAERIKSIG